MTLEKNIVIINSNKELIEIPKLQGEVRKVLRVEDFNAERKRIIVSETNRNMDYATFPSDHKGLSQLKEGDFFIHFSVNDKTVLIYGPIDEQKLYVEETDWKLYRG